MLYTCWHHVYYYIFVLLKILQILTVAVNMVFQIAVLQCIHNIIIVNIQFFDDVMITGQDAALTKNSVIYAQLKVSFVQKKCPQ